MAKKSVKKSAKIKKPAAKPAAKKPVKAAAKKPVAKAAKKAAPVKKPALKAKPVAKKAAPKPAPKKGHEKAAAVKAAKAPQPPARPEKVAKKAKMPPEAEGVREEREGAEAVEDENEAEEIVLTDAEGRRYCRVKDCDQLSTVEGYCRYHYLLFWKKIQVRKKILTEGKLERYIEELTARYPDKFLDMLRKDLRNEKEFLAAIAELEIDESASENEFEDEAQTYIDEVRGMAEPAAREEEDF